MTKQVSFTNLEKVFSLEFRMRMNQSEDGTEVMNNFSYTASNMIKEALNDGRRITVDDVLLTPHESETFRFSSAIMKNPEFSATLAGSDIKNIISRFAGTAKNKYMHLEKHNERTNSKLKSVKIAS